MEAYTFASRLTDGERTALVDAGRARRYARGSRLFHEGERSDFLVLLLSGRVKIVTSSEDGAESLLSVRGPGDLVGEFAAIDGAPRLATALALEPLEGVVLTADEFRAFLARFPRTSLQLVRALVDRLRESDRRRMEFGAHDVTGRLAWLLAELSGQRPAVDGRGVVELSQQELAGLIGASRESVARALAVLRRRGLVETGRRAVIVVDGTALRQI
jgi:CRP/FNR family transcriptional regulator, cyclic AMP receptor protein